MERKIKFIAFISILKFLLFITCCATASKGGLIKRTEEVTIAIKAPRLDVFDTASQVIIEHGFAILTANERIGLITTDYKDVKKTFGGGFVLALFGKEDVEVMLTTNITSSEEGCILTILPKGRWQKTSRRKVEYEEVTLSKKFLKNIEDMARKIKELSEQQAKYEVTTSSHIEGEETTQISLKNKKITQSNVENKMDAKVLIEEQKKLRVIVEKANIRLEPTTQSPIMLSVGVGTLLKLIEKVDNWYKIIVKDKEGFERMGYIYKTLVVTIN